MNETFPIRTARLLLAPMSDDALLQKIAAEPDAHMRQAYTQMHNSCLANPAHRLFYACWLAVLPDGTPVGDLCFKGPPVSGEIEIGYGVDSDFRCRGYAAEAVDALCAWAFDASDALQRVMAEVEPDNAASRRVLEKLGFIPDGTGVEGERFVMNR